MVEVVWNEGQHFGTVGKKLDKFSTFGGGGGFCVFGRRETERSLVITPSEQCCLGGVNARYGAQPSSLKVEASAIAASSWSNISNMFTCFTSKCSQRFGIFGFLASGVRAVSRLTTVASFTAA